MTVGRPSGSDAVEFQRERRIMADRSARTDPYILADDDCLLETADAHVDRAIDRVRLGPSRLHQREERVDSLAERVIGAVA